MRIITKPAHEPEFIPNAHQEKIDKWTLKSELINRYYRERELPKRAQTKRDTARFCTWCEKFKELEFFHCLNCGASLRDPIA